MGYLTPQTSPGSVTCPWAPLHQGESIVDVHITQSSLQSQGHSATPATSPARDGAAERGSCGTCTAMCDFMAQSPARAPQPRQSLCSWRASPSPRAPSVTQGCCAQDRGHVPMVGSDCPLSIFVPSTVQGVHTERILDLGLGCV